MLIDNSSYEQLIASRQLLRVKIFHENHSRVNFSESLKNGIRMLEIEF